MPGWMMYGGAISLAMMIAMMIDCALNRREPVWFFVLVIPFGWLCYLIYHWRSITFPVRVATLFDKPGQSKRCSRCQQSTPKLEPFEDGRSVHFVCAMCRSELELRRRI